MVQLFIFAKTVTNSGTVIFFKSSGTTIFFCQDVLYQYSPTIICCLQVVLYQVQWYNYFLSSSFIYKYGTVFAVARDYCSPVASTCVIWSGGLPMESPSGQ